MKCNYPIDPDWNLKHEGLLGRALTKELAEKSLRTGVETMLKLGMSPDEIVDRIREIAVELVQEE